MSDSPMVPITPQAAALKAATNALGKGVHPSAIRRLLELWPQAVVRVRHGGGGKLNAPAGSTPRPKQLYYPRWTVVQVFSGDPAGDPEPHMVAAVADCHPGDQYRRAYGIALAFNRALKKVPR